MSPTANEYDVAIIGAGPGGATAAYYLARESRQAGRPLRVALLEKARFPRDKYCGDAWCAPALDILDEMGILEGIIADGLYHDTTSGGFVSPNGESYMTCEGGEATVSKENRTFAIKRIIGDERIARRAAELGAELIEEANVSGAELDADGLWRVRCADEREFRCKMLLAADGAASRIARALGVVTSAPEAAAARRYIKGGTHNFKAGGVLLFPEYILPGYVALFRHYNDDLDLGAYLIPGGAAKAEDVARIYEDKILNDPFIQRVLGPKAEYLEPVRTASLRMGGVPRSTARQFMAIGDAAGQTDPLTGEGIHTAMIGGRLAARRVLEMFAANDFDEAACGVYHQRWMDAFGKDFKSSAMGARMGSRYPYFLDAAVSLAQRSGSNFMNDFGAIMTGVKPKSTYARPEIAFPWSWEVSKQFFRQKVLRQASGWAAYVRHAEENSSRKSSFSVVCLRDERITAEKVRQVWAQRNRVNPAEEFFASASAAPEARPLLIPYGSEFGFCKKTALRLAGILAQTRIGGAPLSPRVLDLDAHALIDWSREPMALFICATAGDGEAPDKAKAYFEYLNAAPGKLNGLHYMLLACGDTTYPNFCKAGHTLDELLTVAGARRLLDVFEVDREDETQVSAWISALTASLEAASQDLGSTWKAQGGAADYLREAALAHFGGLDTAERITRERPCRARIVARTPLTSPTAESQTVSLEVELRDFPDPRRMEWQPGDALGVLPHNAPALVERVLDLVGLDPDSPIDVGGVGGVGGGNMSFKEALLARLDIKPLNRQRVERFVERLVDADELAAWQKHLASHANDSATAARAYAEGRELIDLLEDFPETARLFAPVEWTELLPAIQPRFYSISSSPLVDAGQMTLTVSVVRYETHGRAREGLASTYLAERLAEGEEMDVFLQANKAFRPPALDAPVGCVMIGPGTGVAPFRGFVQHLTKQAEAAGKTLAQVWREGDQPLLFFGCRHPEKDFLYADEWQDLAQQGAIRLVTAFSRAQAEKMYVQHRLREHAALIWERLERGAHFFICGDATHMAGDVEQALLAIIAAEGKRNDAEARAYMDAVAAAGRYHKDVWA